jgi:hypothetical protein
MHEIKTRDEEEVAQEAEEEEPEAAGCARTGPSMAELLAASSPPMANYRPMLPISSLDTPSLPKALHHSKHNLVRKDADFPNLQLPTLPLAHITILTTATTNAPFAQAKFFATRKSGHATLVGPSSTCPVSKSGPRTKGLPLPSNKVERMEKYLLLASGGVLDAIFRKTPCPRHTRVGVRKRLSHVQSLVCHHTLAETPVVEKEFASVLILVN